MAADYPGAIWMPVRVAGSHAAIREAIYHAY